MLTKEQVIEALKTVYDPEIALDIWFLGLIYNIEIEPDTVKLQMTFTSPMCPMGPAIVEEVRSKVQALGAREVKVEIVFNPPWVPSEEVKAMLGLI